MPKKQVEPKFTSAELQEMTHEQKLGRIVYWENEIRAMKQRRKDENASAREYIEECQGAIDEIANSVNTTVPEGSVQSAER